MLIQWYRYSALVAAACWAGSGLVVMSSSLLSPADWAVNLVMGLLFLLTGWLLHVRASRFYGLYLTFPVDQQKSPSCLRFLRFDLLMVVITCLAGALVLVASISRVYREGYAVFG
jgi:hypothetical protein